LSIPPSVNITAISASQYRILREVARTTFLEAFNDQNDPQNMEQYLDTAFHIDQVKKELSDPQTMFYFVRSPDQTIPKFHETHIEYHQNSTNADPIIGYLKFNVGKAQTELKEDKGFEIERIYIIAEFQGKGIGSQLLQFAKERARELHKRYIWLGVWQKNEGAIQFYKRHGFSIFSSHPYTLGSDIQTDYLMKYELQP